MGIQRLNTFIMNKCHSSIQHIHFKDLKGYKIAVDVSMFLYKFKKSNSLIKQMYKLCSLFRRYKIHPIFVFDGKPPDDKLEVINKRKERKKELISKRLILEEMLAKLNNDIISCKLAKLIKSLQKQSIFITREDIKQVKQLLDLYGMIWMNSDEEADTLCAYLCKNNYVDAVMSDDTDMIAFGCKKVLRCIDIYKKTMMLYDVNSILETLQIDENIFRKLCSISKNDIYNGTLFPDTYNEFKNNADELQHNIDIFNISNLHYEIPEIKNKFYQKHDVIHYINSII